MAKTEKIQAYVEPETKKAIQEMAKKQERSESYVAGKILDERVKPTAK